MYTGTRDFSFHDERVIPISDMIGSHLMNCGLSRKTPVIVTSMTLVCPEGPTQIHYDLEYGGTIMEAPKELVVERSPTIVPLRPLEQCAACGLKQWCTMLVKAVTPRTPTDAPYTMTLAFNLKTFPMNQDIHTQVLEAQDLDAQAALLARLVGEGL